MTILDQIRQSSHAARANTSGVNALSVGMEQEDQCIRYEPEYRCEDIVSIAFNTILLENHTSKESIRCVQMID